MVFSSLLFIFAFLALNLAVYYVVAPRYRNLVLLVFSLVFYAWGGPKYLLLLLGEAAVSWAFALAIERSQDVMRRRVFMAGECVVLLGLLAYFKYAGLIVVTMQSLFAAPVLTPDIVLPIGISFYTFQLISYVADVYRGQVQAQPAYWKLLMYAALFHQCIAGPIVRYETVANEIDQRRVSKSDVYLGIRRFCVGLAKKAVLANACAAVADSLLPVGSLTASSLTLTGTWLGMIFYTLQIYLDFSAYSDMAIGMGRMVGFHYLENFNYPYMATSVQDFWRRWHISLSSFFRDYVYIPLGGSRCSTPAYIRNMTVVWLLTGLWHGASWNFVLWGAFYLVFLLLEKFVLRKYLEALPSPVVHLYLLLVVIIGWVLFRFDNFAELGMALGAMIGFGAGGGLHSLAVQTTFMSNCFLLAFCIVACTNLGKRIQAWLYRQAQSNQTWFIVFTVLEVAVPIFCLVISVISLAGDSYNPFIYFRF